MNVLRGNGENWQGDWGCISIKHLENQENDKTKTITSKEHKSYTEKEK